MRLSVSVIIPCKEIDKHTQQCLQHCLNLNYDNYEIILLPDNRVDLEKVGIKDANNIKIIPTGAVKPSRKRNIAIQNSTADILAFIDSDAYPVEDWLKNAVSYFQDKIVGGVGGPNLTPPDNTFGQKVSGLIFSSPIGAGNTALRYQVRQRFRKGLPVKEMPSCNLLVRREHAIAIGGFDESLLTGEDAKMCFQIRKLDKKILYVPDAVVYHHRRHMWRPHLRQIWNYGKDKARVIKENFSFDKLYYFIPFFFILFLFLGTILSLFSVVIAKLFLILVSIYLGVVLIVSLITDLKISPYLFFGIVLTHVTYGFGFFYGLVSKRSK